MESGARKPKGAGRSSFNLLDSAQLLRELDLRKGSTFLDLGCGRGEYAIAAAERVGEDGLVYAVDLWKEGIETLREDASSKGLKQIKPVVADITSHLPFEEGSIDLCFMATVLHDLVEFRSEEETLKEVRRMLKKEGTFDIVEYKKIDGPPGPPITIRLTPEEVEDLLAPYAFRKERTLEVGPYHYLITFSVKK